MIDVINLIITSPLLTLSFRLYYEVKNPGCSVHSGRVFGSDGTRTVLGVCL